MTSDHDTYDRHAAAGLAKHLNPGGREPMRDNPTSRILVAYGISLTQFAGMVGIRRDELSKMMNGHKKWSNRVLRDASQILQVPASVLRGDMTLEEALEQYDD